MILGKDIIKHFNYIEKVKLYEIKTFFGAKPLFNINGQSVCKKVFLLNVTLSTAVKDRRLKSLARLK